MDIKKIAIFGAGWGEAVVEEFVNGIMHGFKDVRTDLYFFMCYATPYNQPDVKTGELNIFNLPNLSDFDGAIIYGNSLDFEGIFEALNERCNMAGIPTVCTGKRGHDICYIGADNASGTVSMVNHLLDVHHLKDFFFIAGSKDNADSEERRIALIDTLNTHGLSLSEDHCHFTEWAPEAAEELIVKLHNEGAKMPEVFVCANDILAMATVNSLANCGYKVPDDIKVTGFDHEFFSRIYDPAISSVDQSVFDKGVACAEVLVNSFVGIPSPSEQIVPCKFIPLESCGCTNALNFDAIRRQGCKSIFTDHMKDSTLEGDLTRLENTIMSGQTYDDIRGNFARMFSSPNGYIGPSLHVVLEPLYGKSIANSSRKLRVNGYSRVMDAVFSMENYNITSCSNFDSSKLVPQVEETGKNRFFLFLPLHDGLDNLGYMILCDDPHKISNYNRLSKYANRLNMILSKYRQQLTLNRLNAQLKELSETDPLTHVKNRSAFESHEASVNARIKSNDKPSFAIVMFDINNLKPINDQFGHDAGDDYIIECCRMICDAFKRSPVYRIGGDEFLAFLSDNDYAERDVLLMKLRDKMDLMAESGLSVREILSTATGLAVFNPETDKCVGDVFKRADEAMYENKRFMKNGGTIR